MKYSRSAFWIVLCILFLQLLSVCFVTDVCASNVNAQTLARIRSTLNIDSSISNDRLQAVLNQEVSTGVSIGNTIETRFSQIDFGFDLKNGIYYSRYQDYFNNVLNDKLNVWNYWKDLGVGELINFFGPGISGDMFSIFSTCNDVADIFNLFILAQKTYIDSILREYINARVSGISDADAWDLVYLAIHDVLNVNLDNVHAYYQHAWFAYYSADNYVAAYNSMKQDLNSKLLPQPVITVNSSTGVVPLTVNFDAFGSTAVSGTSIQSYSWDFGDGNIDTGITTSHIYSSSDWFTVTLSVTDSEGVSSSATKTITVTSPVHASFTTSKIDTLTIHFDTSSSTDVKGNNHLSSYSWDFGDGATTITTNKQIDHVYSADAFRYVKLTVADDLGYSGIFTKVVKVGNPPGDLGTTINGETITGNETWSADGSPYVVNGSITVARGATLTIEPGVTIKLNSNVQFNINGTLNAIGASTSKIKFTWADGLTPWYGILFVGSGANNSRLENCVIEHAIHAQYFGYRGIVAMFQSSPTIIGCTISNSASSSYGIDVNESSSPVISNNTISGTSTNYGILVSSNSTPTVTGNTLSGNQTGISIGNNCSGTYQGNTFSGNTNGVSISYLNNNPVLSGNTYSNNSTADVTVSGTITGTTTWEGTSPSGTNYVLAQLTIAQGATLNIQPGVTVKLGSYGQFYVNGTLKAMGVKFTWADGLTPWYGILFVGSGANNSRLENCVIEHAIHAEYFGNRGIISIVQSSPTIIGCTINNSINTGISVEEGSSPMISNSTLSGMTQSGISISNNSSGIYQGNTFSGNTNGVNISYLNNNPVLSGNTYSNNSTADVTVSGTITGTTTWDGSSASGTNYLSGFLTIAQGATLTIQPGVTVKLTNYGSFYVSGTLKATGTTFTWADGQNQYRGIQFTGAGASGSRLENCIFEHAQGGAWNAAGQEGVIQIVNSSPTLTGCTISNSDANGHIGIYLAGASSPVISNNTVMGRTSSGIYVSDQSTPTVTGNTLSGNLYGIFIVGNSSGTYQGNSFTGNTSYALYYSGPGTSLLNATNNNWGDPSGPLDDSDDRASGGWYNPNGKGNKVSDHVNYFPWTGTTIGQPAVPTGLSGTPGNAAVNLKWNAIGSGDLGGYKIYYGTATGNYGIPLVVGNISSYKLTGLTNGTPYFITISSQNTVGAESAKSTEVTVKPIYDVTAPVVTITSPSSNAVLEGKSYTVKGTANDGDGTGVNTVEISTDSGTTWQPVIGTSTWSYAWQLPLNGTYTLSVRASDNAGNVSAPLTLQVTVTNKGPVISFSTLTDGAATNNPTLNVAGTVTDPSGVKGITINGQAVAIGADNTFSFAIILVSGANTITTVATNTAGNQTTDTRTITLDQTAPVLTITAPADNSKIGKTFVDVTGTVDENSNVSVNGSTAGVIMNGMSFSSTVNLVSGLNTIDIIATDLADNTTSAKRTVTSDTEAPSLAVSDPAQDITTEQSSITISGTVSDTLTAVTITITADGQTYTPQVTNGGFTQAITLSAPNTYAVIVTATDEAGNKTPVQRNIIYVKTATGDINGDGDVTIGDALLALRVAVGLVPMDNKYLTNGDVAPFVNGKPAPDGNITISDALIILRKSVGLINW